MRLSNSRLAAAAAAVLLLAACTPPPPPAAVSNTTTPAPAADPTDGIAEAIRRHTTTTTRASRTRVTAPAATATVARKEIPTAQPAAAGTTRVSSTAYCLTGTMANGRRAHWGAVAMNGVPFGTAYEALDGPFAGHTFIVSDRIGHSSQFDIAMPGNYGRRTITIRRAH